VDSGLLRDTSHRDDLRRVSDWSSFTKRVALLFVVLVPLVHTSSQRSVRPGYINDNSDWWSSAAGNSRTMHAKVQHRLLAPANFRILGITLGDSHSGSFPEVIAKLGKAMVTSRGDGAEWRDQICYVSSGSTEKVHLIFEKNEAIDSFYLFSRGSDWTGSDRCAGSDLISGTLSTDAGIHLGESRGDVEAILGQPSGTYDNGMVYSFEGEHTLSPEEYKRLHPYHSNFPDKTLVWAVQVQIDARFENSKLTYLAVSRSEVN
jgi:hypothetical protein